MSAIEFSINDLPKLPNQTLYSHWRVKHAEAKKWKKLVATHALIATLNARERPAIPFKCATVTLTRLSSREPDSDNLMASWKYCLDGLVEAGVIENDKPSVIGTPVSLWCKSKMKDRKVHIKIESRERP